MAERPYSENQPTLGFEPMENILTETPSDPQLVCRSPSLSICWSDPTAFSFSLPNLPSFSFLSRAPSRFPRYTETLWNSLYSPMSLAHSVYNCLPIRHSASLPVKKRSFALFCLLLYLTLQLGSLLTVCPKDKPFKLCIYDKCLSSPGCPNHPSARCRMNYCGECSAEYFDENDRKIDCNSGKQVLFLRLCYLEGGGGGDFQSHSVMK